jgi:hypothetical protein
MISIEEANKEIFVQATKDIIQEVQNRCSKKDIKVLSRILSSTDIQVSNNKKKKEPQYNTGGTSIDDDDDDDDDDNDASSSASSSDDSVSSSSTED